MDFSVAVTRTDSRMVPNVLLYLFLVLIGYWLAWMNLLEEVWLSIVSLQQIKHKVCSLASLHPVSSMSVHTHLLLKLPQEWIIACFISLLAIFCVCFVLPLDTIAHAERVSSARSGAVTMDRSTRIRKNSFDQWTRTRFVT